MEGGMISKETLGSRVREIRQRRKMTLKDVEVSSGLSATHISEIERGMTSPTVGALIRIAGALEKDPGFFIEPRELDEVCITSDGDRTSDPAPEGVTITGGRCSSLTRGILGGRITAREISLDPGGIAGLAWPRIGDDACFYCVAGGAEIGIGGQVLKLGAGDSVHGGIPEVPFQVHAGESGCHILVIADLAEDPHRRSAT
jgi:transcriptional regulator with XRE-family HTH domain